MFNRQKTQTSLQRNINNELKTKPPEWGYDSFKLCGYQELRKLIDEESAKKNHSILFVYKEIVET